MYLCAKTVTFGVAIRYMVNGREKNMMKKNWIITFFIFFSASIAAADEIEQAFSGSAPQEVVESTRQLIQSDINRTRAIDVTRAMLQNRFNTQQILKAHKVMRNAYQQGVPLEPIISRVSPNSKGRVCIFSRTFLPRR